MKTYSTKSNAKRAAQKAGVDESALVEVEGGWSFETIDEADLQANAANDAANEPHDDDADVPGFLQNDASVRNARTAVKEEAKPDNGGLKGRVVHLDTPVNEIGAFMKDGAQALFDSYDDHRDLRRLVAEAFAAGMAAKPARKPRAAREGGPTKREIAATLLQRAEGATTRDILDATGWPAVSIPSIAKASNLQLRQEKDGKVTRYFGVAA